MTTSQQSAIDEIENWRNKARLFSRSDKLGHLLVNSLDLMQSVVVNGAKAKGLPFKIRGLSMECTSAMADDPIKEDESRSLHYGVTLSLCALLIAMTGGEEEEKKEEEQLDDSQKEPRHLQESGAVSPPHFPIEESRPSSSNLVTVKEEKVAEKQEKVAEMQQQRLLTVKEEPTEAKKSAPTEPASPRSGMVMMDDIDEDEEEDDAGGEQPLFHPSSMTASVVVKQEPSPSGASGGSGDSVNNANTLVQMLFARGESPDDDDKSVAADMEEEAGPSTSAQPSRKRPRSSGVQKKKKKSLLMPKAKKVKQEIVDPEEKPFACEVCEKTFETEADVARHAVIHGGLKCKECGRRTTTMDKLIEHYELRHPDKEPETIEPKEGNPKETDRFPCPQCDKRFGYQSELDVHILTHTGVNPFPCTECDKAYKQKSHLKDHLRKAHGILPHECKVCGEKFERVGELSEHKKANHKKKMINGEMVYV